jgi:REP element-mobilizing transposase RayT
MAVRRRIPEFDGIYFITITCIRWLRLFEQADGYTTVYRWFDFLKGKGHYIAGYVIMPNHLHALIAFSNTGGASINSIISNGKRFMAYELVKMLKEKESFTTLDKMKSLVLEKDKAKGQQHRVFEPSFDWKECYTNKFLEQKLNYIHLNPCRGAWRLAVNPEDYAHSSARFYICYQQGVYPVMSYTELEDVDLTVLRGKAK